MDDLLIPVEVLELSPVSVAMFASMAAYMRRASFVEVFMPFNKINLDLFEGNHKTTPRRQALLEPGYKELEELGAISVNYKESYLTIYKDHFETAKYFVLIDPDEYLAIMNLKVKPPEKWKLLKTFCWLINSLDSQVKHQGLSRFIGFMSQTYFMEHLKLSRTTVHSHINILAKNNLIYYQAGYYIKSKQKRAGSCYGRYKDKQSIIDFVATYSKTMDEEDIELFG